MIEMKCLSFLKKKSLVIDNFAIADGNKAMKSSDIPKAAYLDQTAELADEADETVSTEGEYEGEDIYISRSFESSFPTVDFPQPINPHKYIVISVHLL